MCPTCRGLFRVRDSSVPQVRCPLCTAVSPLPAEAPQSAPPQSSPQSPQDDPATTAAEAPRPVEPASVPAPERTLRRRKRTNKKKNSSKKTSLGWEDLASLNQDRQTRLERFFWVASLIVLTGAGAIFGFLLLRENHNNRGNNAAPQVPVVLTEETESIEMQTFRNFSDYDVDEARENVRRFLTAESFEDYADLIRFPDQVMPLVREYYRSHRYEPIAPRSVESDGRSQIANDLISITVTMPDFSKKPIALQVTEEGRSLIDWESWVSYCERPWDDFLANRITEETLVRVRVSGSAYFNYGFQDDKWRCYRLERPDDEAVAFGYLPLDSPMHTQLPSHFRSEGSYILKVRFPEEATSPDQVIITDFLTEGWVFPTGYYEEASAESREETTTPE